MLSPEIRHLLKRIARVTIVSAVGLILIAYAVDYGVFRYEVAAGKAFGQVTVTSYDAVQQKSGRTQFLFRAPQAETCVKSLFPHAGFVPCWYLQRHTEQRTDI
jgi:hypothetical protein